MSSSDQGSEPSGAGAERPVRDGVAGDESLRIADEALTRLNALTSQVIGAAIEVHRVLGPGLLETMYETAMCIELEDLGLAFLRQERLPAYYKGRLVGDYRIDLIVNDLVIVEIKSVTAIPPVFEAQLLTYLRLTRLRVGLLINFHSRLLKDGIRRMVL
jgi:GxxExxY protein